jgi:nuclear migration protein JNM1
VDFSDRVSGKRKSYRTSNAPGRRKQLPGGTVEYGDFSDEDEEDEGLERKLARLRREVEELKVEIEERKYNEGDEEGPEVDPEQEGVEELGRMLETLHHSQNGTGQPAAAELARKMAQSVTVDRRPVPDGNVPAPSDQQTVRLPP